MCLAISRIRVATFFCTYSSGSGVCVCVSHSYSLVCVCVCVTQLHVHSLMRAHACAQASFVQWSHPPLSEVSTAGKTSASTTISARSSECLATCERAENTCRFRRGSGLPTSPARWAMAPASTTVWASWGGEGRGGEGRGGRGVTSMKGEVAVSCRTTDLR